MTGCIVKLRGLDSIELNDCGGHVRGKSLTLLYRPIGPYLESMADFCSECLSDVQCWDFSGLHWRVRPTGCCLTAFNPWETLILESQWQSYLPPVMFLFWGSCLAVFLRLISDLLTQSARSCDFQCWPIVTSFLRLKTWDTTSPCPMDSCKAHGCVSHMVLTVQTLPWNLCFQDDMSKRSLPTSSWWQSMNPPRPELNAVEMSKLCARWDCSRLKILELQVHRYQRFILILLWQVWHEFCRVLGIDLIPFLPALAIECVFFKSISDVCFLS